MRIRVSWWLTGLLAVAPAGLAQVALPQLPGVPVALPQAEPLLPATTQLAGQVLRGSVRVRADALLRRFPQQVERDPRGAPIVRSVIIALSPAAAALQQALAAGYQIQSDTVLAPLGERAVMLLAPRGVSTQQALQQLRQMDPTGTYDFDHMYTQSAAAAAGASPVAPDATVAPGRRPAPVLVGLIDSGVDVSHPVFAGHLPELRGCGGKAFPDAHGTAVASLLVGTAQPVFHGADPGGPLIAVDVYCGATEPGGRVRDIVAALADLAGSGVGVINISMVGPDNAVLKAVINRVLARSIVIVAAAGNDGPRAAPLYPAAYPGVVAVTAVDAHDKVLLEANSGPQVQFAAPGADMVAAVPGGGYAAVRGTSYAAPLVAGLIARFLAAGDAASPQLVLQKLADAARDKGRKGRDPHYGYGIVADDLRVAPRPLAGKPAQ